MQTQTLCSGSVAGCVSCSPSYLVVALREEGVIIYDTRTNTPVRTWALGLPGHRLAAAPAYAPASQLLFAAAQPASDDPSAHGTLLTWPRKAEGGSLKQAAQAAQLPAAVHSLHAIPAAAGGAAAAAMELDNPAADDRPALYAVFASGAVAACSAGLGVVSESREAAGLAPLAAAASEAGLAVVHSDPRSGGASCSSYQLKGGKLQCGPIVQLAPPVGGGAAVAAASTSGRTAVLWSNGTLAVYPASGCSSSSSSVPLEPLLHRRLRGFQLAGAAAAAGGTPQNGKLGGKGSKKRGHRSGGAAGGGEDGGSGGNGVSISALGEGLLAVAGWSTEVLGTTAVRVVVLDCMYGCIQLASDLTAGDVGAPALDPAQPVQAVAMADGRLALVAGCSVLLAELQLRAPTLANLLGALAVGPTPPTSAGTEGSDDAAGNPCARAAAGALHDSELAALVGPSAAGGDAPTPAQFQLEVAVGTGSQPAAGPAQLLVPATVRWTEPSEGALQAAERAAWGLLLDPAAHGKKGGLTPSARALLAAARQAGALISQRLLARLLVAAAERRQWECVGELLAAQSPGSLVACPGLLPALAGGHQYPLLQLLLAEATDAPSDELAAALHSLLRRPAEAEAQQAQRDAQRAYAAAARAAAEAAVAAAEAGTGAEPLLSVAACCAGAVEGFTAAQICLHPLMAGRHDAGTLLGALRQLDAAEALALLRYLRVLLRNYATLIGDHYYATAASGGLPGGVVLPPPAMALEWAGVTLDANMARLVLQQEAAPVLAELRGLVEAQLRSLQRLGQAKGSLEHLRLGCALPAPQPAAAAKYTLEWLDLRVA